MTHTDQDYANAYELHGTFTLAGDALGVHRSTIQRAVARVAARSPKIAAVVLPTEPMPGFRRGKVTLACKADGTLEKYWDRQTPDEAQREENFLTFIAELATPIKGLAPTVPVPDMNDGAMLSVYPVGDQHHGMRTEASETGDPYDCKISAELLLSAVSRLCATAPASEEALLLDVGDFHHANDSKNETPGHGHALTVDGTYTNVMYTGGMALVMCVLRLLEKHKRVRVWIMPGNHNPDAAAATAMAISFYFHNEPRVIVDLDRSPFKYLRFGVNLIAAHHGDGTKAANLPLIMANDRKHDWAATEYRVWHCGHIHHKTLTELVGCDVETHRTLAPNNAWDFKKGYRSKREMQRIDYHIEFGEDMRTRCDVKRLRAA